MGLNLGRGTRVRNRVDIVRKIPMAIVGFEVGGRNQESKNAFQKLFKARK